MKDTKIVTYKQLKPGQKIEGWTDGHWNHMSTATVKDVNPAFVTVMKFGTEEEKIRSDCMFTVELSDAEFKAKYHAMAKEIVKNIQTKLQQYEIGYHEMWNAWVSFDPYEMAAYCKKDNMKIVGHCTDILPKTAMFSGDTLDIGVCAEYEDGEKFWCHARSSDLWKMVEQYEGGASDGRP